MASSAPPRRLAEVCRHVVGGAAGARSFGHTVAFGLQYYERMMAIMRQIAADAAEPASALVQAAAAAAAALQRGKKVYANIVVGHIPKWETANSRAANPGLFICGAGSDRWSDAEYAAMGPGDVLLTQWVGEEVRPRATASSSRWSRRLPYIKSSHTPPGEVVMGGDEGESTLIPEDVATIVVESHMPWSQGLVDVPAWPFFPYCPAPATAGSLIHWSEPRGMHPRPPLRSGTRADRVV